MSVSDTKCFGTIPDSAGSILRCNIFQDHPDFVHADGDHLMTAVPYQTASPLCTRPTRYKFTSFVAASAAVIGTLAAVALANRYLANKAERDNPPSGHFLKINGVRLHYVERGAGDPVVLLHGNGSMIQDFESSGLIDLLAKDNRVIVFDRPGFGPVNGLAKSCGRQSPRRN